MNRIVITNREPQQITIGGGGQVIGVTEVLVNGVDVTVGSVAYVVVPTKTSELENDSGYITQETDPTIPYYIKQISQADINSWNNKQNQLVSGVNIKTINGNNILGSGNIDIDTSYTAGTGIEITEENVINNTITSYNDLTDLPTIPTKTSDLLNDSNFVSSTELNQVAFTGSYNDLTNTPSIPTATSDLENDSGFITNRVDDLINYYDKDFIYNLLPKVSDSGSSITLNNTYSSHLKLTLNPSELSQDSTPTPSDPQNIHTISGDNTIKVVGKNLFNESNMYSGYYDPTSFVMTSNTKYRTLIIDNLPAGTYTFNTTLNNCYLLRYAIGNTNTNIDSNVNTYTFTTNTAGKLMICFRNTSTTEITETFYTMLNEGSTALPYEPYDETDYEVYLGVENLFDKSNATYKNDYIKNNEGQEVAGSGQGYLTSYVPVKPSTQYTIQGNIATSSVNARLYYYDSSKGWISRTSAISYTSFPYTFTTPNNCYYIQFQYDKTGYNADTIQIELGNSAHPYTEYGKAIEYCKIGDYSDRIFKNVEGDPDYDNTNLEVGLWYIKKNIGKVVLDGSQSISWSVYQNTLYNINFLDNAGVLFNNRIINGICNRTSTSVGTNLRYADNNCKGLQFYNVDTYWGLSEVSSNALNTYLASNNLVLYYPLATPTYTLITDDLEDEINAINNATSKNEQTNISQINNDLPFIIDASTLKDISNL